MSTDRYETTTLRDVAEHAGVSLATASRVVDRLGPRPDGDAGPRRARDARPALRAAGLRSRPARSASSSPSSSTRSSPRSPQAMETQRDAGRARDHPLQHRGSTVAEADYVHMLLERRVDGMIFISSEAADLRADHSHYARLLGEGARLVFVNGAVEALDVPPSGSTSARPASSRPSTCSSSATGGSASSPGRRATCPTREKAAGRVLALARPGSSPTGSSRTPSSASTAAARRCGRCSTGDDRPTGRDLLERPDGDRRAAGSDAPRASGSRTTSRSSASTGSRRPAGPTRR